jgi:radical SAM superfamily enzyme YgiQ (UPF0313 family)
VADALRAAGFPVVMGGPHVTELPDEALGRNGVPRHADAVALGEADESWPRIVADAAAGRLKEVYGPVNAFCQERKPSLKEYPAIPWESLDLQQFNRIPAFVRPLMAHFGYRWETFHIIPIESGRGCPYGSVVFADYRYDCRMSDRLITSTRISFWARGGLALPVQGR